MEVLKLKTIKNLANACIEDERLELINGEIIKRPMARPKHGIAQGRTYKKLESYNNDESDDWWFITEVSVCYNENNMPCHCWVAKKAFARTSKRHHTNNT